MEAHTYTKAITRLVNPLPPLIIRKLGLREDVALPRLQFWYVAKPGFKAKLLKTHYLDLG